MKTIHKQHFIAIALVGALAFTSAQAQQAPLPKTAADVPGPPSGTVMTKEYVTTMGRTAYLWGWPIVNARHRRDSFATMPSPGSRGGLPAAPTGYVGMLTDYITPEQRFVAHPNQDMVYGFGFSAVEMEPIVIQLPDFGDRFWVTAVYDARSDEFSRLGKQYGTKPGLYMVVGPNWKGETPKGITAIANGGRCKCSRVRRERCRPAG